MNPIKYLSVGVKIIFISAILAAIFLGASFGYVIINLRKISSEVASENHSHQIISSEISRVSSEAIIIGILIFVILFFIFLFVVKRILSPLEKLTVAAEEIGKGKFSEEIIVDSQDEIGKLAKSFNLMATSLENNYKILEQKVDERTMKLQEKVEEAEKLNQLMVDRELKMIEMKKQIESMREIKN